MSNQHARELAVHGLKEFKDRLRGMVDELDGPDVIEVLAEVGEFLTGQARENLPSTWLVLPESIGFDIEEQEKSVTVGPRYGFATELGDPVEFGIYHEFGIDRYKKTPKPGGGHYLQGPTPARHYLERAIAENEPEVVQIIARKVLEIVERNSRE